MHDCSRLSMRRQNLLHWTESFALLPCESICLRLQSTHSLLLPAVCLPKMHHTHLHMLPVKPMSTSRLKALHDSMHVDVMPGCQHSLHDMLGKHGLCQKKTKVVTTLRFARCVHLFWLVMHLQAPA